MEVPVIPGYWICSRFGCSFMNFAKRTVCRECGKAKKRLYDDVKAASENEEDDEFLQIEISPDEQAELFFVPEEPGGSKDNLEIFHGDSDFTLEKDAVVEPTTEGPTKKKRNKNNTAESIFSLLMGAIFEKLRKTDEDDMSDSFSDISLD
ncbi:hypothetical protein DAPPUDRAFT_312500 [Daphnia pulex]|uniref:RanBP2-type domain-containing protein n=1 Tax=Daphnia pulex TaxID=6669 RepID=E9FZ84_DAPPU|nr:hypothetical protein DAPPUDRAFT_312500 [Daphnia pulex]|eukprot:EFX87010.1 hypothetical protein DAPPUDRAFT_312500 [Daphnia pulex]